MPRDEFDDWDKMEFDDEEDEGEEEEEELDDLDNLVEEEESEEDEDEEISPALSHGEKVGPHAKEEGWEPVDQDDEVEENDSLALDEDPDLKDKPGTEHGKAEKGRPQQAKRRASVLERKKQPGHGPKRTKRPRTTGSKGGSRRK